MTRAAGLALAGLALGLVLAVAGSPTDAQAKPVATASAQKVVVLKSLATGYALDSNEKGQVYGLTPNGGSYQRWIVRMSDFGGVTLQNRRTGRCLDSDATGKVYTLRCNGGSFQNWMVKTSDFGTVVLRNLATGRVLDGNAERKIYALAQNGGAYQKWKMSVVK